MIDRTMTAIQVHAWYLKVLPALQVLAGHDARVGPGDRGPYARPSQAVLDDFVSAPGPHRS